MSKDVAIEVRELTKEFIIPHKKSNSLKQMFVNFGRKGKIDRRKVLNNITFDINKGEFFGIVGRNGSGKSTLLKLLAGVYVPTKGAIGVNGSLTPFIELGVGFNPELTGRENVYLNGALLGFTHRQMQSMYKDIVDFAELAEFMDQKLKNYSSGMQVRLAFSIAIRAKSDILLIDEVLAVGDASFQQKCFDYFAGLKNTDKTIILVSHDMNIVRRFCTSAIYIRDGKLTYTGDPVKVADIYIEENMDTNPDLAPSEILLEQKDKCNIDVKIQNNDGEVTLKVGFKTIFEDDLFVGFSIFKDGVPIAGITTEKSLKLKNTGNITYIFDTKYLNGGIYGIGVALFKLDNRELIGVHERQIKFKVNGYDSSKDGALKLADSWKYDN